MRIICAWCGKDMGVKKPFADNEITSSICKSCFAIEKAKIAEYHAQKRNLEQAIT